MFSWSITWTSGVSVPISVVVFRLSLWLYLTFVCVSSIVKVKVDKPCRLANAAVLPFADPVLGSRSCDPIDGKLGQGPMAEGGGVSVACRDAPG